MLTETCKFTTLFSTNIYPNIVPGKILYLHYLFIRTSHHLQSVYYMIYNYCDNEIENIKYISPLLHTFPSSLITACNIHAIFTYIHPGNSSRPSQHRWQNPHMLASQKKKIFHASYHKRHTAPFFTLPTSCFPEPSRQKSRAGSLARVNSCSSSTKSFERIKRKKGSS